MTRGSKIEAFLIAAVIVMLGQLIDQSSAPIEDIRPKDQIEVPRA